MLNRREFFVISAVTIAMPSCAKKSPSKIDMLKFDSPLILKNSILDIKHEYGIKYIGERAIEFLTLIMLLPGRIRPKQFNIGDSLLTTQDYDHNSTEDLVTYAKEIHRLNREHLKEDFMLDEDDKIIEMYDRKEAIILEKKYSNLLIKVLCSALRSEYKRQKYISQSQRSNTIDKKVANESIILIRKFVSILKSILKDWVCEFGWPLLDVQ